MKDFDDILAVFTTPPCVRRTDRRKDEQRELL